MSVAEKCAYVYGMIRKYGIRRLAVKAAERRQETVEKDYIRNWQNDVVTEAEWNIQRNTRFESMPLVSVVVPAYETPQLYMEALMESLQKQSYENWELCIADGSRSDIVETVVQRYAAIDARIRYSRIRNQGIAENTNAALMMAEGVFIGFLDHDDVLALNALYEMVRMMNAHPECEVFYSDEDKIDETGVHHMRPHFKLDYNRELLLHYNYICHFLVVKAELLHKAGVLHADYDGAQDYDLVLRLAEQTGCFCHVRKILYHWRVHKNSTAGSPLAKNYAYDAGKRALEAHFERMHIAAGVSAAAGRNYYDVHYDATDGQMEEIDYKDICTPDALDERIRSAAAEYLLIKNSHLAGTVSEEKKQELLALCMQRRVGMVGVRFQKKGRIISSGIDCRPDGDCGYLHTGLLVCFEGYFGRASIPQNVRAVPLEFFVIRREAYEAAGRMEFGSNPVAAALHFADGVRKAGYEIVLDAKVTVKYKG